MQGARRRPWWVPRASRATPQTPLSLPTLRDRADFPSCGVVASLLGYYPTSSAPPCLRGNLPRSRPRGILRQAPRDEPTPYGDGALERRGGGAPFAIRRCAKRGRSALGRLERRVAGRRAHPVHAAARERALARGRIADPAARPVPVGRCRPG